MTEPTLSSPNYFDFGRAEVCQDAFIAWLASWADRRFSERDPALHALGCEFIRALARTSGKAAPLPAEIRVQRQREFVDIVIEVGDEMLIVVEDKAGSTGRVRQLDRYAFKSLGWKNRHGEAWADICLVYLKTIRNAPKRVQMNTEWAVFDRSAFLEVLPPAHPSEIAMNFRRRLEMIEREHLDSFSVPVRSWSGKGGWARFESFVKGELSRLGCLELWRELRRDEIPHVYLWPVRGLRVCVWPEDEEHFLIARRRFVAQVHDAIEATFRFVPLAYDAAGQRCRVGNIYSSCSELGVPIQETGLVDTTALSSQVRQFASLSRAVEFGAESPAPKIKVSFKTGEFQKR